MVPANSKVSEAANILIFWSALATIVAALPMPYVYYTALRLFFCGVLCWLSWRLIVMRGWPLVWLAATVPLVVLYNPFIPVHLGSKWIWVPINIVTVGVVWGIAHTISKSIRKTY